jgi:MinD-like ATPase involved in chromosome partitioning or flagellar assembly
MVIIAVLTTKGGATKTTVSTWLSATLASVNHSSVAIFDVDRGGGKVAKRFGFNPKTVMTTDRFVNHILAGESFDHSTLVRMTESDPLTGVTVFHSQPGQSVTAEKMETALTVLKTELHTLVIDTGPGVRVPSTNASAAVSNVQVVVGNGNSGDDLSDIAATLAHQPYKLAESYAQDEDGNVTAFGIKDSVVIAISGLHRLKCNTRSQYAFAEQYGVKPEKIVLIPFNRYLRQTGRVKLSALEPRTLHAFYQLAARVARIAVLTNKQPSTH